MKFSSALHMTTVLSILSIAHGAPVHSVEEAPSTAPVHGHYRRASSVSELEGRTYSGSDMMSSLNYAFEPGSHVKTLLNFVKRQIGASATSATADNHSGTHPSDVEQTGTPDYKNNQGGGLMGGGMTSPQDAGFAFEPGQGIRAT